jgi:Brp/Blh family beta-carotene 15,15'-monooxygenase
VVFAKALIYAGAVGENAQIMTGVIRWMGTLELAVWMLSLCMLLLLWVWPAAEYICLGVVALGLVFPGIPHGALDNHLVVEPLNTLKQKILFYVFYVGVMVAVLICWLLSPAISLVLFICISALHFGETDNMRYGISGSWTAFLHGLLLLIFMLASHADETTYYLDLLRVKIPPLTPLAYDALALTAYASLCVHMLLRSAQRQIPLILFLSLLALSAYLPLIIAFGVYFVFVHSVSAWLSLCKGLSVAHWKLMKLSAPYSILAVVMLGVALGVVGRIPIDANQYIAWFFIFLSCISTPHILIMHFF